MTIAPDPPMFPPTPSIAPPTGDSRTQQSEPRLRPWESSGRVRKFLRGKSSDPPWVRLTLLALLGATSLLYIWGLSASGWANSFDSAAAQAGSTSWKAFFFGSSDAANSITVDKPAMSLWPQALAILVFRSQLVEHLGARGSHGGCDRRECCTRRFVAGSEPRSRAPRRAGDGIDAGGRTDVPLQQSRTCR